MGSRRTLLVIVAVAVAALAAAGSFLYLQSVQEQADEEIQAVPVFIVKNPVARGDQADLAIANGSFVEGKIAQRNLPPDAVRDLASLKGKVAVGPISEKAVLTQSQFADPTTVPSTGAQRLSQPNLVLVTLPITGVNGVGGNIVPGDTVNLVTSYKKEGANSLFGGLTEDASITRVFYQKLKIVYIGTNAAPEAGDANAAAANATAPAAPTAGADVTFAVPQDAADRLIRIAQNGGSMWLTLVREDYTPTPMDEITAKNAIDSKLTPYE